MKINLTKILLALIVLLLLLNLFKGQKTEAPAPKITIVKDTVWQTKTDTINLQTVKYKEVFVYKDDPLKIVRDTVFIKQTDQIVAAKEYRDTLQSSDIDIYSYNLTTGDLLKSNITYRLKVPREILTNKTVEPPTIQRSGLYLFTELGGNKASFDNLSLGLQYMRKGKWFASYRVNLNQINRTTHNVGVGFRLFN